MKKDNFHTKYVQKKNRQIEETITIFSIWKKIVKGGKSISKVHFYTKTEQNRAKPSKAEQSRIINFAELYEKQHTEMMEVLNITAYLQK